MYETVYPFSILLDFVLVFESTSEKKIGIEIDGEIEAPFCFM